MPKKPLMRCIH